jgi:integrase
MAESHEGEMSETTVTIKRRHSKSCKSTDPHDKSCGCRIYKEWRVPGIESTKNRRRKTLKTRNWQQALKEIREKQFQPDQDTLGFRDAANRFLERMELKDRALETTKKYERLFDQMEDFGNRSGLLFLQDFTTDELYRFLHQLRTDDGEVLAPLTRQGVQAKMKAFFKHCYQEKWIASNPAWGLEPVKAPERKREIRPITSADWGKIINAVKDHPKLKAFVLILRYTGMRIRDVVTLRSSEIEDGRLVRKTQKRGTIVNLKLDKSVLDALEAIEPTGEYYFWSGNGKVKSCVGDYQRALKAQFEKAGVQAYAHLFRHSLVSELIAGGAQPYDIAKIVGHKSSRTTEEVYAHWIKEAQNRQDATLEKVAAKLGEVSQADEKAKEAQIDSVTIGHKKRSRKSRPFRTPHFVGVLTATK